MKELQCCSSRSRWTVVVTVAVFLLVGSVIPSPFPRYSEFERLGPDKFLHFVGHAGLATALVNALETERQSERTAVLLAISGSTTYGIITNSIQRWIPTRDSERTDMVAGFLGSVVGAVAGTTRATREIHNVGSN
ncbi:VanZ family protein [Halocatena salina]|uniref:VanZ family protein n=1 Tax=Halocatena salina TaxID=2934340 RepID=A0A8U0A965_9EURY|nr:VanZ family protein [Halocatena salina]UPM45018.1 VanZ family protein [Halocatena salina]